MAHGLLVAHWRIRSLAVAAILVASEAPSRAADKSAGSSPLPSAWQFTLSTYSWLPWLSGDVTVKGRRLDVDVSPDKIIQNLDWSTLPIWMSYAEARNGPLFLFNDIVYSKIKGSAEFARSRQGGLASLTLSGGVEADYEQATIEVGAGYTLMTHGSTAIDGFAGARYWHQRTDISADLAATLAITGPAGIVDLDVSGDRVVARSGTIDWIDPFIGARVRHEFSPMHRLTVRGDVGGFGAGSEFSWQAMATLDWQVCQTGGGALDAYVGYRALSVDYSEGAGNSRYRYNVLQHGPVLGMSMKF